MQIPPLGEEAQPVREHGATGWVGVFFNVFQPVLQELVRSALALAFTVILALTIWYAFSKVGGTD